MKAQEKAKARRLCSAGQSVKQIAKGLGVSKSSVSTWVQDVPLSDDQLNGLIQRVRQNGSNVGQARAAGYRSMDEKERCAGYEQAKRDPQFRVLCGMYWGEGAKTKFLFDVTNTDPRFIRVICSWLGTVGVEPPAVQFRLQYHRANGLTETAVIEYWLAEVPYLQRCALRKCRCVEVARPSQTRLIGKCPYGTCNLYVHKSRRLYNLVMGGIEYLSAACKGD